MEQDKINAYMTLYTTLVTVAKLAAPMVPFITEDMYQNLVRGLDPEAPESIHLTDYPEANPAWVDKELEEDMDAVLKIVVMGRACRNTANIKNRQPIGQMFVKSPVDLSEFYGDIIKDELNVKNVKFTDEVEDFTSYSFKPQMRTLGPKYGKKLGEIRSLLAAVNGNAAMKELRDTGMLTLALADGTKAVLSEEDLLIETAQTPGYVSEVNGEWTVVLDTNLTPELLEEGFLRELTSKIQTMRKEAGFEVMDHITVYAAGNEKAEGLMKAHQTELLGDVMGDDLVTGSAEGYVKEWKINGEAVTLGVKKIG